MKLNEDEDDLRDVLYSISSIHTMCRINQLTELQTFIHHCSNRKPYTITRSCCVYVIYYTLTVANANNNASLTNSTNLHDQHRHPCKASVAVVYAVQVDRSRA